MGILNKFNDRLTLIRGKRRQDSYNLSALRGARRLALFFIPKREEITGGIMSIFSLAKYSRIVDKDLVSLIVTLPASVTHSRNSLFPNDEQMAMSWWRISPKIFVILNAMKDEYEKLVDTCALRLGNLFSVDTYCDNLKRFYQGKYDFTPTK